MSKSPWGGKIGDWAAETERADAEELAAAAAATQPPPSFPSLKEAVNTTTKQKKKTKMTLQEFTMQPSAYPGSAQSGLTREEMSRLPTGPKERSHDEMQHGRLGGGFSNYGTRPGSMGSNPGRERDYEGRRSYVFEDDNRRGGQSQARVSEFSQPSRADEVDNWASMKKQSVPEYTSGQDRPGGRYSSLGGAGGGGPGVGSRADEVDNWASLKKPISQPQQQTRSSTFGSGFFRPEPDRWTRNEQRLVLDPPKIEVGEVVKVNKPNPFGAARPREDVLAEKGLDWKKLDLEIEVKKKQNSISGGSRPVSSQSSRPGSAQSGRSEVGAALVPGVGEGAVKQKPKVNPFGDAKPREVLLEEKGLDWKKIDLGLEHRVERSETEEEKNLKQEIEHMKNELLQKSGEDHASTHDLILQREQELKLLSRQLDDKVRYNQKVFDRPPSQPGAYDETRTGFHDQPPSRPGPFEDPRSERPLSRPGAYEDPRGPGFVDRPRSRQGAYEEHRGGVDYNERPRSRGNSNVWKRPGEDRRAFQGGGGRGFLGSMDGDRSASRW